MRLAIETIDMDIGVPWPAGEYEGMMWDGVVYVVYAGLQRVLGHERKTVIQAPTCVTAELKEAGGVAIVQTYGHRRTEAIQGAELHHDAAAELSLLVCEWAAEGRVALSDLKAAAGAYMGRMMPGERGILFSDAEWKKMAQLAEAVDPCGEPCVAACELAREVLRVDRERQLTEERMARAGLAGGAYAVPDGVRGGIPSPEMDANDAMPGEEMGGEG